MASTSDRGIAQWIDDFIDDTMMETATIVSKIGEDALTISREEHLYRTQTGNLQSSCGFTVTLDGMALTQTDFTPKPGTVNPDGDTGSREGKAYMEQCLQQKLDKGISLIMVAGMDYAGKVEDRGGDVLKSAEAHIRQEFDKLCRGAI